MMVMSSSSVHRSFLMLGFRWLCHRSRHCLPIRPCRFWAISDQFLGPNFKTMRVTISSSSFVHGPFTRIGLRTFCHLWRHWTSVLSLKKEAIFFQFRALKSTNHTPYLFTNSLSFVSSSCVQKRFFEFFFWETSLRLSNRIFFWRVATKWSGDPDVFLLLSVCLSFRHFLPQ